MNNQEIVKRLASLQSQRYVIQETWDSIERYIAPYRGRFFRDEKSEESVEWRRPYIYDGTAVQASQTLSSSLHSALTSPSMQWFGLRFRQEQLNDDTEALEWLEESAKRCYMALQDSNFNVEINETYQDLVDFGTSAIVEEVEKVEGVNQLVFRSVPIKQCFFEQDHHGQVINFYRQLEWTPLEIYNKFGDDGTPTEIKEMVEEGTAIDQKLDVVFCVFRRYEIGIEASHELKIVDPLKRPFGWKYLLKRDGETLGEEGGYFEMPAFLPRWRKTSSSMWGNSPSMVALADVLTINRMIELNLQAIEKVIDPATLTTSRGLVSDLDLNAGGLTVVRDINEIATFESKTRFDAVYNEIGRIQESIKDYYFVNQLVLPPMQGTPATATEIGVRMQQLERLMGATFGRLQTDLLDKVVNRTFRILWREGRLPEMPDSVAELGGSMEIEYTSPLAKSQQSSQVSAIERWTMFGANLAQVNPEVLDLMDFDEIMRVGANLMGVPAKLITSKADVETARQERQAQEQAMQEAQMAQEQGAGMQAVAEGQQAMEGEQP